MSKGKIAFYFNHNVDEGLGKILMRTIDALASQNVDISIFATKNSIIHSYSKKPELSVYEIEPASGIFAFYKLYRLAKKLRTGKIKALFLIGPNDFLAAVFLKLLFFRKIKLVYFQLSALKIDKIEWRFKRLLKRIDTIITPYEYLGEQTTKITGYANSKIHIVHPAIEVSYYQNKTMSVIEARKQMGLPKGHVFMGTLGIHQEGNKQDFLIRAVQFLRKNNREVNLLIMGETTTEQEEEYLEFLRSLASECAIEKHVFFRPCTANLGLFFKAIDFFVLNTPSQPFNTILQKSISAGVPIIAISTSQNKEILDYGRLGLLYTENDMEDFSAKLIRLLSHVKIADHFRDEGLRTLKEKYDYNVALAKLKELTEQLTDK